MIAPADAGRWQARWDFDEITFLDGEACGRVLPWLVPALDGSHTIAELEQAANGRATIVELHEVLACLDEQSFLIGGDGDPAGTNRSELASAIETLSVEPPRVLAKLEEVRVIVFGRSPVAECTARSLAAQGFSQTSLVSSEDSLMPAFSVVIEADWPSHVLDAINRRALETRQPWMLVGAWNRRLLVGPILVPGETACYECYRRRLDSHRRHLAAYRKLDEWRGSQCEPADPEPVLPAIAELAAAWVSLELFNHISGVSPARTLGRVLVYYPAEGRFGIENVLRIPWCPVCSAVRAEANRR